MSRKSETVYDENKDSERTCSDPNRVECFIWLEVDTGTTFLTEIGKESRKLILLNGWEKTRDTIAA